MRAYVTGLAAVLALAGCKQEAAPDAPKTVAEAVRESAGLPKPTPGLYRSEVELLSVDAPGMPPQMAEQMKAMMAKRSTTPNEFCLTGEEAAKGYEERVKKLAGRPECKFDRYSADAGKLDAQLTCTGAGGVTSVMTMQGAMSPEGSDVTLGMNQSGGKLPGGGMKMTMRVKSQRVGECPAKS
jgi:hypothetical protein